MGWVGFGWGGYCRRPCGWSSSIAPGQGRKMVSSMASGQGSGGVPARERCDDGVLDPASRCWTRERRRGEDREEEEEEEWRDSPQSPEPRRRAEAETEGRWRTRTTDLSEAARVRAREWVLAGGRDAAQRGEHGSVPGGGGRRRNRPAARCAWWVCGGGG
jgi:hypothetical protein